MSYDIYDAMAERGSDLDLVAKMAARMFWREDIRKSDALEFARSHYDVLLCDDDYDRLDDMMEEELYLLDEGIDY
jgi:hypothetical protein